MGFIKKAQIVDRTSEYLSTNNSRYNDLSNYVIDLDLSFSEKLMVGDTIWFSPRVDNDFEYPYILNFSEELLNAWSDGWYQIVTKTYHGIELKFEVIEIHCEETKKYLNNFSKNDQF